jgi:hypothetical protein
VSGNGQSEGTRAETCDHGFTIVGPHAVWCGTCGETVREVTTGELVAAQSRRRELAAARGQAAQDRAVIVGELAALARELGHCSQ